jgi:hypothetical protein
VKQGAYPRRSLPQEGTGARVVSRSHLLLSNLFIEQHDPGMVLKPDRIAVCALDQILGVTVGMHVDLDAGSAVADWAVHLLSSFTGLFI